MSIYTKTGDKGTTALFDGSRVKKYNARVDTYGTFDECNAAISVAAKFVVSEDSRKLLEEVEEKIFSVCAELATEHPDRGKGKRLSLISQSDVEQLERAIDSYMEHLPAVKGFILPGASKPAAFLHQARTIVRRGERLLVKLADAEPIRQELLKYTNRLSDLLYTIARDEDMREFISKMTQEATTRYIQSSKQELELDLPMLQQLSNEVVKAAESAGIPVVMAVADESGQIIFSYAMKDVLLVSHTLASKKAYTAVAMKSTTHELSAAIQPGSSLYQLEASMEGKIVTFGGGYPIKRNGTIIGALGISGGTVEQDMAIAEEAISRIEMRYE